jgi:hypothetical protein
MRHQPSSTAKVLTFPARPDVSSEIRLAADRPRSILFVRSVALPIALESLAAIRAANPDARITVLTNEASTRAIETSGNADEVLRYSPTRYGIVAAGLRRIGVLRVRRFDLVLVPYIGRSWLPFWNVGRFALALRGLDTRWLAAESASTSVDLTRCEAVTIRAWSRAMGPGRRARLALVALLKWPALLTATVLGLAVLAIVAPVLFLFVWLTPPPENGDGH